LNQERETRMMGKEDVGVEEGRKGIRKPLQKPGDPV
jgi:hypothetical protein